MGFGIWDAVALATKTIKSRVESFEHIPEHDANLLAGELHIGEVSISGDVIDVTPTIQAAAYDTGDVLFSSTATITDAMRINAGKGKLESITLIDKGDQGAKVTLVFFKSTESLGTVNVAPSIADADIENTLGYVIIDTTDYLDVGGAKFATLKNIGLLVESDTGSKDIFFSAIVTGTPTYASTSDLVFRFGFERF